MSANPKPRVTEEEAQKTHNPPIVRRPEDLKPEMGRFANVTQMVFHPSAEQPTEPNAGVLTYAPGAGFPLHMHDFAQVWYVIEGTCRFGERILTPGDMVYMQDPHYEYEMHTEEGCKILFVQYQGPTTGESPIYEGRFNKTEKPNIDEEDLTK
jgi:quercetin dioxygenase-like cupin family protein